MSFTLLVNDKTVEAEMGMTVLGALSGVCPVPSPCGGRGTCGKCAVTVNGAVALACQTEAKPGMVITTDGSSDMLVEKSGVKGDVDITWSGDNAALGIACDIGTTTVVCHLVRLSDGKRLGTVGQANAQSVFGADVISRIQTSVEGKLDRLNGAIIGQINDMIGLLCASANEEIHNIKYMAVAGNTVMCHLFAKLPPDGIGVAPFNPVSLFGGEYEGDKLGLIFKGIVYITPSVAGYVGGDITADILSCAMQKREKPVLMIDVGTNGEMALSYNGEIFCCATAAGPAFEGAEIACGMMAARGAISAATIENGKLKITTIDDNEAVGICGSGLIDAAAAMLDMGAVDETGLILDEDEAGEMALPYLFDNGDNMAFRLSTDGTVYITQQDVRRIQLAKAAIAAGIAVLVERSGLELKDVSNLLLAGGFGSKIDPVSAARIGLIPPELLPVTKVVGNAAGEGAVMALLSEKCRDELVDIKQKCKYIELSSDKRFTDLYIESMVFE